MNKTFLSRLRGSLGIESAEVEIDQTEVIPTPEDETASAEAIEVVEDTAEIDALDGEADDLTNDAETLDELEVAVEAFAQSKTGLSKLEAAALNLTVNNAIKRWVGDVEVLPAHEGYGTDGKGQTVLALESIKSMAKDFKEGVVEQAKKAYEFLKQIIQNIVNKFKGIEGRAKNVGARASNIKGGSVSTDKVKIKPSDIAVGDKVSGGDFIAGLGRVVNLVSNLHVSEISDSLAKATQTEERGLVEYNEAAAQAFKSAVPEAKEAEGVLRSEAYPGNYYAELDKAEGDVVSFLFVRDEKEGDEGEGVQALNPVEIGNLAKTVLAIQEKSKVIGNVFKRIDAAFTSMSRPTTMKSGEEGSEVDVNKKAIRAMAKNFTYFGKVAAYSNKISNTALDFAEKSLAAHDAPAKEEGAEQKAAEATA